MNIIPPKQQTSNAEENPFVTKNYQEKIQEKKASIERSIKEAEMKSTAYSEKAREISEFIPLGQPILVGHHSEKKTRGSYKKINNNSKRAFDEHKKAEYYKEKLETVGKSGIHSNDPDAIKKLQHKLNGLRDWQEKMKAANKALRKNDDNALYELGFTEKEIKSLKKPDFCGAIGYRSYELSNNNAEIKRISNRISDLEKLRSSDPINYDSNDFSMKTENGQIKIFFYCGKPTEETRVILKRSAFKWSRTQDAWVRKVTANAVVSSQNLLIALKKSELY